MMKTINHQRKTLRLAGWDYKSSGWYFVTIGTKSKENFFGEVVGGKVEYSPIGTIASDYWGNIPKHVPTIELDDFVVMSNHLHGIIIIPPKFVATLNVKKAPLDFPAGQKTSIIPKPKSLSSIIRSYKSAVTRWARSNGYQYFAWQPRFYDHIIRDDEDLRRIRKYIQENPLKWELDEYFKPIA
ncbi:MAG: transposase [Anaerolineales bacterium]|jgi:REP element-mobilizing transposase RayT